MSEAGSKKPVRKPRAVTALAVLFGLLLNVTAATGAQAARETRAALGNGEIVRTGAGLRLASRTGDDDGDRDTVAAVLPPQPRVITLVLAVRPAAAFESVAPASWSGGRAFSYWARAPPAA